MKQRILTALVLIPVVLAAVAWTSPGGVYFLCVAAAAAAALEAAPLLSGPVTPCLAGYFLFFVLPFAAMYANVIRAFEVVTGALWLAGVVAIGQYFRRPTGLTHTLALIGAGFWTASPFALLVFLHQTGVSQSVGWRLANPLLLLLLPLWAGDTAAYFAGRAWGKRLFAPAISPKKTWAGAIANFLACVAVAVPVAQWIGYAWAIGLWCGFAIGTLGQAGDLFESYLKRRVGAKDSGTLLPGHGGLLDRVDSLLFAAPVVALILGFAPLR